MMPVAVEISSAGICAARPSPTVSSEKCGSASPNDMCCWHDADAMPPSRLIDDDQHAGHRVALDELRGAVHRAVEVGLARRSPRGAARASSLGDQAGVQVGVDRHLLAGHRVEGEARGDLGDAPGAVRDHDELDHDEDQEDDEADDEVAADDERAERVDDAAGVAVQQDRAA